MANFIVSIRIFFLFFFYNMYRIYFHTNIAIVSLSLRIEKYNIMIYICMVPFHSSLNVKGKTMKSVIKKASKQRRHYEM